MANFAPPGFSAGFSRGAAISQNKQMLELQAQELQQRKVEKAREAQARFVSDAETMFDEGQKLLSEAVQNGATDEQIEALFQNAIKPMESVALNFAHARAQARASGATDDQLSLIRSPGEIMEQARTRLDSTVQVGRIVSDAQVETKQFREGSDFVTRRVVRGQPDMSDAGVIARSPIDRVQRVEQGGPGAFDEDNRTPSQVGAATQASGDALEDSQQELIDLSELGRSVFETPGAVGARGAVGEAAAGTLGQLHPAIGRLLTETISGTDPARLQQIRSQLQQVIGGNIERITGEESGRYTTQEQEITQRALRTSKIATTPEQIAGSIGDLMMAEISRSSREALRQGKRPQFDMLSTDGETFSMPMPGGGSVEVNVEAAKALELFYVDSGVPQPSVIDSAARFLIRSQQIEIMKLPSAAE